MTLTVLKKVICVPFQPATSEFQNIRQSGRKTILRRLPGLCRSLFLLHFKRCDNRGNIKDIRAEPRFFGNRAYGQIYVYQMDLSLKGTFILILSLFEKHSIKGMSEIDRKPYVILILPLWKSGVGNYRRMD